MRIIGDVHGKYQDYLQLAQNSPDGYSVQLGDMGFDYSSLSALDSTRHKFIGGNHDNYDKYFDSPYHLGGFGPRKLGDEEFFIIRGAQTIDTYHRTHGIDWWPDKEELNYTNFLLAAEAYSSFQGDVVLSHDCPQAIFRKIRPLCKEASLTRHGLQSILEVRRPELWVFGHHHEHVDIVHRGCRFVCLPELAYLDI